MLWKVFLIGFKECAWFYNYFTIYIIEFTKACVCVWCMFTHNQPLQFYLFIYLRLKRTDFPGIHVVYILLWSENQMCIYLSALSYIRALTFMKRCQFARNLSMLLSSIAIFSLLKVYRVKRGHLHPGTHGIHDTPPSKNVLLQSWIYCLKSLKWLSNTLDNSTN